MNKGLLCPNQVTRNNGLDSSILLEISREALKKPERDLLIWIQGYKEKYQICIQI
jgi:hypothetical protein